MSLESSSENYAAWKCFMRASICADGMTCLPRHIPVVIVGPGGTERGEGGQHTDVVDVGTKVVMATRRAISITSPSWVVLSF